MIPLDEKTYHEKTSIVIVTILSKYNKLLLIYQE